MFENFLAEMTRKRTSKKEMAAILGITEWTLTRKLNGDSQFTLEEMQKAKEFFNNEYTIEHLFFVGYESPAKTKA